MHFLNLCSIEALSMSIYIYIYVYDHTYRQARGLASNRTNVSAEWTYLHNGVMEGERGEGGAAE